MSLSTVDVSEWLEGVCTNKTDDPDLGAFRDDTNVCTSDDLSGYHYGFDEGQARPVFRDATPLEIRRMDAALALSRQPTHATRVSRAPVRWSADEMGWEEDDHLVDDAESVQGDETEEETDGSSDESSSDERDQHDLAHQLVSSAKKRMRKRSRGPVVKRSKFDSLVVGGHLTMHDKLAIVALGFKAPTLQSAHRKCERYILGGETEKLSNMLDDLIAECEPRSNMRSFVMVPSLHDSMAPVGQVVQEILGTMQYAERPRLRELVRKVQLIITHIKNIE